MFIFRANKKQKKINAMYRELERRYTLLDTLKEELWNNRLDEKRSNELRAEIEVVQNDIKELKSTIIRLES